ncbi:MAG: maf protein [Acidobacteria bacterium]|nr:maf protein [Acidobacteriota bacterium]
MHLVLASASPRRAELLRAAGYTFDVVVANVDESIRAGEAASTYVRRLAAEKSTAAVKAMAVLKNCAFKPAETVVLGADTTVVVDGRILGKPRDEDEGREMLRRLSGKTHQVLTGVSLRQGADEVGRVDSTDVTFAPLTSEDIEWYTGSGEGRDKAGGYAIQGLASRFIPAIAGSYANVVGLPVATVAELLRSILASSR